MKEKKEFKKKELENEKRMLNFKKCSLMKKQLFTLMMAFALIMGLSVSAWAQTVLPTSPVEGSRGNPKIYITGATDSVSITRGALNSTVSWVLYKGTSHEDPQATAADIDFNYKATGDWDNAQTSSTGAKGEPTYFHFKWTDTAAGQYYLEVTETDKETTNGVTRICAETVRGYHIYILGFDVAIYASNAAGDTIDLVARQGCGGPTYPAFLNDVVMNVDGSIRTDILNTATNNATNGTSLNPIIGTHATRALRYYTAELHFDGAPTGTYVHPAVGSVMMDIKVNVPAVNNQDSLYVASINAISSENMQGDKASIKRTIVNLTEGKTYKYTFPVEFNDSWEFDLLPTASVQNVTLFSLADGTGLNLGEEPVTYEDLVPEAGGYRDNTSNAFTIFGKPATGPITD